MERKQKQALENEPGWSKMRKPQVGETWFSVTAVDDDGEVTFGTATIELNTRGGQIVYIPMPSEYYRAPDVETTSCWVFMEMFKPTRAGAIHAALTKAAEKIKSSKENVAYFSTYAEKLLSALNQEIAANEGGRRRAKKAKIATFESAKMSGNEYQSLAMVTSATHASPDERLLNGVMGLCGESGEVADLVKKHRFHGTTLDEDKLRKELGDVLWYVAQICDSRGWKMGDVMAGNIEKLKARWPEGFKTGDAAHEESRARE